jgi:hypothetical protein
MKNAPPFRVRVAGIAALFLCLSLLSHPARAGETADAKASPAPEEEPDYKNWIELAIGGVFIRGDQAQFEQEHRIPAGQVYGGIQDLHYEQTVGKDAQLVIDGHALWDFNDYDLKFELSKPKLGYIRGGYTEFRSWYDGNGGFLSPQATWFPPTFPEMHIDRGEAWIELGLRVPDWPEITFHYAHEFRDGQKDSTTWGDTTLTGITPNGTRKIVPAFRNIDEKRDIFSLDIAKTFGNTDFTFGGRYEHISDNDSLNMERGAGQLPPAVPPPGAQRFVTQHINDDIDLFSGHAITETRFSDSLWFTTGYSYTSLENDTSGSRNFGTQYDSAFGEPVPTLGQRDHAYMDLAGMAQIQLVVFNGNLFWMPLPSLSVLGGFRYTHEAQDTNATYLALEPVANVPPPGFSFGPPTPASGERTSDYDRFAERLELRYTGINDWVFYLAGEWEEESGHVFETQVAEDASVDKDTSFVGQKYTVGANWYPLTRLSISARYYHKIASYDNTLLNSMNQRLLGQDWNTDNANIRVTWRPPLPTCLGVIALVSRYDYVHTTIDSQWFAEGDLFQQVQSGEITKHVISESLTWNPMGRLYLQGEASYVLDQTNTPASQIDLIPYTSPTVLNFHNDYWTVTAAIGYALDDKTDLNVSYSYYHANDFVDNAQEAVPYGMGATENSISAGISRQLTKQIRLSLQYTYYHYDDVLSGGHNNYEAHSLFSSLHFRF